MVAIDRIGRGSWGQWRQIKAPAKRVTEDRFKMVHARAHERSVPCGLQNRINVWNPTGHKKEVKRKTADRKSPNVKGPQTPGVGEK